MYFKYPYSDMYALNLDWMIKSIKEVQEIIGELGEVVNSVNGESGEVTISAEMVNATDINGTMVTTTDPSTQPQSVLAAYYENGIRVILVRNNLGVIDRCFFLSKYDSVFNLVEYIPTSSQSGVRLINGLSGDVTLTGENITLSDSDQQTIAVIIAALNNRTGTLESNVGDLTSLKTYNKTSLVAAINELVQTDDTIFEDIGDISQQIDDLKPITVTVTVDTNGASMSAADQAKFTPDMIMCGYSVTGGIKENLKSDIIIRPGQIAGTASVSGSATAQVVIVASFIHTANA